MKPVVLLFLSSSLLIVARAEGEDHNLPHTTELSFSKSYPLWIHYRLEKYVKNGGMFFKTGQQFLLNYTTIDTLNVKVTEGRHSFGFQLSNVIISGFSNISVDKFETGVDFEEKNPEAELPIFKLNVTIPTLQLQGSYRVNGISAGRKIACSGHFKISYANISAGIDIFTRPSASRSNRADFEKVEIRYVKAKTERVICLIRNRPAVESFGSDSGPLLITIGVPMKFSLVEMFQGIIQKFLADAFLWDAYYHVLTDYPIEIVVLDEPSTP